MAPIQSSWSRGPWWRYTTEPPTFSTRVARDLSKRIEGCPDDASVTITAALLRDLLAHVLPPEDGRPGAEIHDHDRHVTYRATVDPATSDLDHLEVIVHGWIDDNAMKRVPVARIRREVLAQVAADAQARAEEGHGEVFTLVLPGGLTEGDGTRYAPPPLEEVAQLMRKGLDRHALAERYGRPVRTVDGWIRRARQQMPDQMPARTSGRRRPNTPGGNRQSGDHNK
ncbi:MAG: hypothetical protein Q8Q02_12590 [Nocardioides sp.]|nr:hypothetical protein [Nocardioides sp.]